MSSTRYVRAKELLEAELGDELVALDVEGGHCFGFNSVATDIWRLLARPLGFEALHEALTDLYDVDADECSAELQSCLDDLQTKGLIRIEASVKPGNDGTGGKTKS
jgi:hypothetical protein